MTAGKTTEGKKRYDMANWITGIRILCGVLLLLFPPFSKAFYILYLIGGLSDALDGWTARKLGSASDFGARLDTAADIVFFGAVLLILFCHITFPLWMIVWVILIALLRMLSLTIGFITCHRLVSAHSLMNRASGFLLFLIPWCIEYYPSRPVAFLVIVTCAVATAASIQELYQITKKHLR